MKRRRLRLAAKIKRRQRRASKSKKKHGRHHATPNALPTSGGDADTQKSVIFVKSEQKQNLANLFDVSDIDHQTFFNKQKSDCEREESQNSVIFFKTAQVEITSSRESRHDRTSGSPKESTDNEHRKPEVRTTRDSQIISSSEKVASNKEKEKGTTTHDAKTITKATADTPDIWENNRARFGTFDGSQIYRNRILDSDEGWRDGHFSLDELVLPGCCSALCTSFSPPGRSHERNHDGSDWKCDYDCCGEWIRVDHG